MLEKREKVAVLTCREMVVSLDQIQKEVFRMEACLDQMEMEAFQTEVCNMEVFRMVVSSTAACLDQGNMAVMG